MHDDAQVVRVAQMFKAIHPSAGVGQFPVRWVPDLGYGYGYPIFNFYNPLPYYAGALGMFIGLDALMATKIMFIFPIIGSLFSMYLLARLALSKWGALAASIFYLYAPYHGVQIYVRGSVAEYWAYAIVPLVFYSIWKRKVMLAGVSLAALIISHNLTAFMSIPFLIILFLFQLFKSLKSAHRISFLMPYALSLILALGLSAFFWIPAVFESSKTQVAKMVLKEFDPPALHTVTPFQLWSSPWGYGGSSPRLDDGLSLQLGKIHVIGSIVAVVIVLSRYLVKKELASYQSNKIAIFSISGLALSIYLITPLSEAVWNSFPVLSYIQFPWRFLTFASFFSSLLAALAIESFATKFVQNRIYPYLFTVYCLLFIVYSLKFFQPQFKFPTTAEEQTRKEKIVWEVSKRSDEYLPKGFQRPESLEDALRDGNKQNQLLIDALKSQTPVRTMGNLTSLATIMGFSLWLVQSRMKLWNMK